MYFIEQIISYVENLNIKESEFRVLEIEFSDAQKHIEKLNQEKMILEKNREK